MADQSSYRHHGLSVLDDDDGDDPILSVVNIIDVFLVIIAVLLITVMENPINPFSAESVTVIKNPGQPDMEITVKDGREMTTFAATGQIGSGTGTKAGIAYRLEDGSMVYVPQTGQGGGQ
ncbi:DUF2149 domain-containing protein [Thalassovita aquimarina]|uniref:DUF2149 domain-containing protein n=1 Tax=Thalassovita aquimarina TaxID=2785917 RepID=A0ABS5HQQ0_9RHOB|nr:DUF2149 domain-containing protein [Thalassovita aquimarina]MBR9651295.1 DUF2149 domain-containing protein [Thalassovita aquimarina]